MKLRSVRIRHYKSLDDVSFDLNDGVTLLVGPNAAGKSNVVDCLRFVRDAIGTDLEHAVSSRGGIARVRQYAKTKPFKVVIQLSMRQEELPEGLAQAEYEFSIDSLSASNYVVDHESGSFYDVDRESRANRLRRFSRGRDGSLSIPGKEEHLRLADDQLALGSRALLFAGLPLERYIRDWRFSSIYPNRLREPSTPDKDSVLSEDGRNWASVIKALRRTTRGRQALERISEAMRAVVPTFVDVTVSSVGSYLVPHFHFSLKGGKDTVAFDPVQLSDGTLRIFGILLALYQTPPPKLLLIEEPEQTVHPGVLAVLADAFKEAAELTQVVVTTHSPHLVDHFAPEQVRVVSLRNGTTNVERVRKTQVEAVKRRLMSLQEFMVAEGLQGEVV